jgi:hypothetical protein
MISDDLRLDIRRTDPKMPAEMNAKSQAVQECASTQYAIVTRGLAGDVGERIGRIGDGDQHCHWCSPHDLRHDLSVNGCILVEELEPPLRIAAIDRAAVISVLNFT